MKNKKNAPPQGLGVPYFREEIMKKLKEPVRLLLYAESTEYNGGQGKRFKRGIYRRH